MILKEDKKEIDAIKEVCALMDFKCNIYTIESNDQMIQLEITSPDGSELKPEYAWRLGKMVTMKMQMKAL